MSAESKRKWRLANPARAAETDFRRYLKRKYSLSLEEYKDLLKTGCGICRSHKHLKVDHCHTSNKVRSALCTRCNYLLGLAKDNILLLMAAALYLCEHFNDTSAREDR